MASRIITKKGSGAPLASDLVHGELAVDTVNKRLYTEDAGGTVIEVGTNPSTIDINAGTIDGTVIGGSTAAAGSFTTLTASGDVTISGGTANGVAFANGSKVLTTGGALWFDGTNFGVGTGGNTLNQQSVVYKVGANAVYQQIANGSTGLGATNGIRLGVSNGGTGELYSPTALISYIDNTEQMRLTSTGLGIGTSSPDSGGLHINSGLGYLTLERSGTGFDGKFRLVAGGLTGGGFRIQDGTTDRFTIDSSGNLGIGTSSSYRLDVLTEGNNGIRVNAGTGGADQLYFGNTGGVPAVGTLSSDPITLVTAGTERARLDTSGNLIVGSTSANPGNVGAALYSNGFGYVTSDISGTNELFIFNNLSTSGTAQVDFRTAGTAKGDISWNNTSTTYNTTSDYRLKDNIQDVTGSGTFIDALQPRTWSWKVDGSAGAGFIAHELQSVSPSSVRGEKDAVDIDGNPDYQSVEYGSSEVIAMLVAEVKDLRKRLAEAGIN